MDFEYSRDSEGKMLTADYNSKRIFEYFYFKGLLNNVTDKSEYPGQIQYYDRIWSFSTERDADNRTISIRLESGITADRYFKSTYDMDTLGNTTYAESGQCNSSGNTCNDAFNKSFGGVHYGFDERGDMVGSETNSVTRGYFSYDTEHKQLTSYIAKDNALIMKETTTHDALGNITKEDLSYRNYSGATQDRTYSYAYDTLNRLTTADIAGTVYGYKFDDFGNITERKKGASTDTFVYGTSDALTQYRENGTSYDATYDMDGNMLSDGVASYTYNTAGRLQKVASGSTTATFDYSFDGMRHSKQIGSGPRMVFAYDQENHLISERQSSGDMKALYTWANNKVVAITSYCQTCSGSTGTYDTYYIHADSTGNVISLTDKNGAIVHTYEYDPYGNIIAETGKTIENPFKYKGAFGYYTDKETGLIYLQQRYYTPKLMRFLSQDPLNCNCEGEIMGKLTQPLDINPYVYVTGNPVMGLDPSGEGPIADGYGYISGLTLVYNGGLAIYHGYFCAKYFVKDGVYFNSVDWNSKGYNNPNKNPYSQQYFIWCDEFHISLRLTLLDLLNPIAPILKYLGV